MKTYNANLRDYNALQEDLKKKKDESKQRVSELQKVREEKNTQLLMHIDSQIRAKNQLVQAEHEKMKAEVLQLRKKARQSDTVVIVPWAYQTPYPALPDPALSPASDLTGTSVPAPASFDTAGSPLENALTSEAFQKLGLPAAARDTDGDASMSDASQQTLTEVGENIPIGTVCNGYIYRKTTETDEGVGGYGVEHWFASQGPKYAWYPVQTPIEEQSKEYLQLTTGQRATFDYLNSSRQFNAADTVQLTAEDVQAFRESHEKMLDSQLPVNLLEESNLVPARDITRHDSLQVVAESLDPTHGFFTAEHELDDLELGDD